MPESIGLIHGTLIRPALDLIGHTVRLMGQKKKDGKKTGGASLSLPKVRKNPLIEIIAINTG